MELALSLEKLTNEKLLSLYSVMGYFQIDIAGLFHIACYSVHIISTPYCFIMLVCIMLNGEWFG